MDPTAASVPASPGASAPVSNQYPSPSEDTTQKIQPDVSGKKKGVSKFLLGLLFFMIILLAASVGYGFYRMSSYKPTNIRVTNVTDRSATVSWETESVSHGVVVYSDSDDFLPWILSGNGKKRAYDDRDVTQAELKAAEEYAENPDGEAPTTDSVSVTEKGDYYVHHVTITGLDPEKTYYFQVGDGAVFVASEEAIVKDEFTVADGNSFTTFQELDVLSVPHPAYGSVEAAGGRVDDGVLYMLAHYSGGNVKASVLSSSLNSEGRWYVDLSNARTVEGEAVEFDEYADKEIVYVNAGPSGTSDLFEFNMDEDAPALTIEVSNSGAPESRNPFVSSVLAGQNCCYDPSWKPNGCGDADWEIGYNACANHECSICPSSEPQCSKNGEQCGSIGECCGGLFCGPSNTCENQPADEEEAGEVANQLQECSTNGQKGRCIRESDRGNCPGLFDVDVCGLDYGCCTDPTSGMGVCSMEVGGTVVEGRCIDEGDAGSCGHAGQSSECGNGKLCCVQPPQDPPAGQESPGNEPPGNQGEEPSGGEGELQPMAPCCCDGRVVHVIEGGPCDEGCTPGECNRYTVYLPVVGNGGEPEEEPGQGNSGTVLGEVYAAETNYTVTDDVVLIPTDDGVYDINVPGVGTLVGIAMLEGEEYVIFIDENENGVYDEGEELVDLGEYAVELTVDTEASAFSVSLAEGVNYVSFEYVPEKTDSCELIKELNGALPEMEVSLLARFESGEFEVTNYRADLEGEVSGSCFPVVPGRGYVVRSYVEKEVALTGNRLTAPAQVAFDSPGWHLIGVNGAGKVYTAESLLDSVDSVEGLDADNVTQWSPDKYRYEGLQKEGNEVYGFDFTLDPGVSYFVRVADGSGIWTPE